MRLTRITITAAIAAAALAAVLVPVAASASTGPRTAVGHTVTASTKITGRPDSGSAGYWANDAFTRKASVTFRGEVVLSFCGGSTPSGHCYHWTGKITDSGTFTTIAGQTVPGVGSLNGGSPPALGVAATGPMAGSYNYDFYSSWKTANGSLVPGSENDGGIVPTGRHTTGAWEEQFFGTGAQFYVSGAPSDELGTTGSWTYTLPLGADSACPHVSSQWVDGSPDWGSTPEDGNILAPGAAHC